MSRMPAWLGLPLAAALVLGSGWAALAAGPGAGGPVDTAVAPAARPVAVSSTGAADTLGVPEAGDTAGDPDVQDAWHRGPARAVVLAYLAGKTGQAPGDLAEAIARDGLDGVLQRAGVTPEQLRQVTRQVRAEMRQKAAAHRPRAAARRQEMAIAVLARASGKPEDVIRQLLQEKGDWREVVKALNLTRSQIRDAWQELHRHEKGAGSPAGPAAGAAS